MKRFRKSGGFTLVELVVSIAVASLVTMAATTVLMLALRVNRQTSDTATQQYTVRALLTAVEKAATSGSIQKVTSNLGSWKMWSEEGEDQRLIFSYDAFNQEILANEIVVMEGVYASNAILDNGLLSISVETKEGIFETTVFVRIGQITGSQETVTPDDTGDTKSMFLDILMSQLNSDGKINYENLVTLLSTPESKYVPKTDETYYSQWYIGTNNFDGAWNPTTPWCACFVSWALAEAGLQDAPKFAYVDKFMAHFGTLQTAPNPGDLVFFDWITDDGIQNPQHVGVVLQVMQDKEGNDVIITIEGNSAGRVAVRSYQLDDSRILGYGILNWS